MGTGKCNRRGCAVNFTFPSQELPCSGSTGISQPKQMLEHPEDDAKVNQSFLNGL